MNSQRILKEAQKIASKFSFWMVSGKIHHLFGYIYERPGVKYELEIKFDDNFPNSPPNFVYYNAIKELLGDFQLEALKIWNPRSTVLNILQELRSLIQEALNEPIIIDEPQFEPTSYFTEDPKTPQDLEENFNLTNSEEYITPDLNAYPSDSDLEIDYDNELIYSDSQKDELNSNVIDSFPSSDYQTSKEEIFEKSEPATVEISTELGLIQQFYAYDQMSSNPADLIVYLTITISKTYNICVNFASYPKKPAVSFPNEVITILGKPNECLTSLKKWNEKKAPHIVDIMQELENKLFFIKDIDIESKKIKGEYQCDVIDNNPIQIRVHLFTYGFKEYLLELDLEPYPKPPIIELTPELQDIIQIPIRSLNSLRNWKNKGSEPVEIIREISWLVDKNSRINFEIELLKKNYKNIKHDSLTDTLRIDMKGKMKTQDITFEFQIKLPREYPMKVPDIKVLNEFEIESQEKIKNDLQNSFKDFFKMWTPFSYLIDLFNIINEKIFEISAVSCVICHSTTCPTCSAKIAGHESCHTMCPYCERPYHKHCWGQTLKSFGKCGFCLKVPPPDMFW